MRMPRLLSLILFALATFAALDGRCAPALVIPETELQAPPTPARVRQVIAASDHPLGWAALENPLREAALACYGAGRLPAAQGWLQLSQWAGLLGQSERSFLDRWAAAMTASRAGHSNMPREYSARLAPLATHLSKELVARLVSNTEFSTAFFATLSPLDHLPTTLKILSELQAPDPTRFGEYPALSIALAVVYDLPPPPDWPHAQVSAALLPRRWPAAKDTFDYLVKADKAGRTFHRLRKLSPEELRFVVDVSAPFSELTWSEQVIDVPLAHFDRVYSKIRYRRDRVTNNQPHWPHPRYSLVEIMRYGGICVDQAYFACQAAKARGVPSLFFQGAGQDGRHAWFGFLDGGQKWRLDAGRFPEQRFVTGYTRDPQTWLRMNDHEVAFLQERFFTLPGYRTSQVHVRFAGILFDLGRTDAALRAARAAATAERRNLAAWDILLRAMERREAGAREREAVLREAIQAYARYPDLEARFTRELVQSLRQRGETSAADNEERRLARKYRGDRSDLSVQQAADILGRSLAEQPLAGQIKTYNEVVEKYGRGAGIAFFDGIVAVFVEYLRAGGHVAEARKALQKGRGALKVEQGSQLDREIRHLESILK